MESAMTFDLWIRILFYLAVFFLLLLPSSPIFSALSLSLSHTHIFNRSWLCVCVCLTAHVSYKPQHYRWTDYRVDRYSLLSWNAAKESRGPELEVECKWSDCSSSRENERERSSFYLSPSCRDNYASKENHWFRRLMRNSKRCCLATALLNTYTWNCQSKMPRRK